MQTQTCSVVEQMKLKHDSPILTVPPPTCS